MSGVDLGVVLGLLGATASTIIAFITPCFVYVSTHPEPHTKRYVAIVVGSIGTFLMPFSVAAIFM